MNPSQLGNILTANTLNKNTVQKYIDEFRKQGHTRGYIIYYSQYGWRVFLRDGNHKAAAAYYLDMSIAADKKPWKDMWSEEYVQEHLACSSDDCRSCTAYFSIFTINVTFYLPIYEDVSRCFLCT